MNLELRRIPGELLYPLEYRAKRRRSCPECRDLFSYSFTYVIGKGESHGVSPTR